MNDTSFFIEEGKEHRFAALYMSSDSMPSMLKKRKKGLKDKEPAKLVDITRSVQYHYDREKNKFLSGGGGLVSTLSDYMKFSKMLLNGGRTDNGVQIISPKTLQFMTMNHLPNNRDIASLSTPGYKELSAPGIGFGLGFSVVLESDHQTAGCRVSDGSAQISSAGTFAWGMTL